jgi:peptidoglycan hydrolase-like protein with peptidoglycan-binding domain
MKKLIITESEREKILNMHGFKKMLSESTLVDLQNLLNTKFSAGLTADGKYGPKTAAAIEKALGISSAPAGTTKGTPAGTTTGTPAGTTTGTPAGTTTGTPAGTTTGAVNAGDIASADKGESSMAGV